MTESNQAASLALALPGFSPGAARYIFHFAPDNSSLPKERAGGKRYSSVSDLERALRTIRVLLPKAEKAVVALDRSSLDRARAEQLRAIAPRLAGSLDLELWDDFTKGELYSRASNLHKDWTMLYLPVAIDREGRIVSSVDLARGLARGLAKAASVPVFSHFDNLLDTGIVGGYMVSASQLGRLMARVAAFGDEAAPRSQAEYSASTMGYYFDARALQRWKIPEGRLPEGSALLCRKQGFLGRFWPLMLALALAFALETMLIWSLGKAKRQRARALALLGAERASLETKVLERTSELERSAREKEALLKELQHRVKNSMSIITSMVGLEAGKIEHRA